ncbi:MAG: hypothetical protein ACJ8LN_02850 [Sulfurifustis sp.]
MRADGDRIGLTDAPHVRDDRIHVRRRRRPRDAEPGHPAEHQRRIEVAADETSGAGHTAGVDGVRRNHGGRRCAVEVGERFRFDVFERDQVVAHRRIIPAR